MLELRQISKSFRQVGSAGGRSATAVLKEITFSLPAGSLGVVIGRSGSGKSTLLSLIAGLDTPDTGEIVIDQQPIAHLSSEAFARYRLTSLGIVFQFFNLLPTLTLTQNTALPGYLLGTSKRKIEARVEEVLALVGLESKGGLFPHEASGGENQRAAIARALLNSPKLILADEPTGNLDRENGEKIIALFRSLSKERGQTSLIVTHDPSLITAADFVFQLVEGKVVKRTQTSTSLQSPEALPKLDTSEPQATPPNKTPTGEATTTSQLNKDEKPL